MDRFIAAVLSLTRRGVAKDIAHIIAAWALGDNAMSDAIRTGHLGYAMVVRRALGCQILRHHAETAVKNGSIRLAIWVISNLKLELKDLDYLFCLACEKGHLVLARQLSKNGQTPYMTCRAFSKVCLSQQWCPQIAEMIITAEIDADTICNRWFLIADICLAGRLSALQWLVERFSITAEHIRDLNNSAFHNACDGGHLDMAQWLVQKFGLTRDDVCDIENRSFVAACKNGHLHVASWLAETYNITHRGSVLVAKQVAKPWVYKWLACKYPC